MLDRVWQSICEGDAESLGLKPDQVFSRHEIPLVVPMLCLTFEDIIQAFATFHDNIIEEWKLELASVIKQKTCLGTGEARHPSLKDDISGDPDTSKVNLTASAVFDPFMPGVDHEKMIHNAAIKLSRNLGSL